MLEAITIGSGRIFVGKLRVPPSIEFEYCTDFKVRFNSSWAFDDSFAINAPGNDEDIVHILLPQMAPTGVLQTLEVSGTFSCKAMTVDVLSLVTGSTLVDDSDTILFSELSCTSPAVYSFLFSSVPKAGTFFELACPVVHLRPISEINLQDMSTPVTVNFQFDAKMELNTDIPTFKMKKAAPYNPNTVVEHVPL